MLKYQDLSVASYQLPVVAVFRSVVSAQALIISNQVKGMFRPGFTSRRICRSFTVAGGSGAGSAVMGVVEDASHATRSGERAAPPAPLHAVSVIARTPPEATVRKTLNGFMMSEGCSDEGYGACAVRTWNESGTGASGSGEKRGGTSTVIMSWPTTS